MQKAYVRVRDNQVSNPSESWTMDYGTTLKGVDTQI